MTKRPEMPGDLFDLPIDQEPDAVSEVDPDLDSAASRDDAAQSSPGPATRGPEVPAAALPLFDEAPAPLDLEDGDTAQPSGDGAHEPGKGQLAPAASTPAGRPRTDRGGTHSGIFDRPPNLRQPEQEGLMLEEETLGEEEGWESANGGSEPQPAGVLVRAQAGAADLLAHLAVLSASILAMRIMDLTLTTNQWPGFAVFLALFSSLYLAFPLAFWGHTPGMAWFGLLARDQGDRPLAFGQTGLRVLASWVTILLLGLPVLWALSGRSLVDRLSRSETWWVDKRES
jgi:uncharacterized RDD family membrane protein YckC